MGIEKSIPRLTDNILSMSSIVISGASGFLGSHIAENLINEGYNIIALKRYSSNLWRCKDFADKIKWFNIEDIDKVITEIISYKPDLFIHTAWNGVSAENRDNWVEQEKNLFLLISFLDLVKITGISRVIALGSQAEYGKFEGEVNEDHQCNPINAYGANKLCASILLKSFAEQNMIKWYWIRLFSVFGPREEQNWLIPSTIRNLLINNEMALTQCNQRYDYLYAKDFATGIHSIIKKEDAKPGVYNMSSGRSTMLKDILVFLENRLSPNQKLLKFGEINYRPNQVMHMQGDSNRFFKTFEFNPPPNIYIGLEETIKYYKSKNINNV